MNLFRTAPTILGTIYAEFRERHFFEVARGLRLLFHVPGSEQLSLKWRTNFLYAVEIGSNGAMRRRHRANFYKDRTIGLNVRNISTTQCAQYQHYPTCATSALTCFAEVLRWGSSVRSLEIKSIASEVTSLSVPAVRAASVWQ